MTALAAAKVNLGLAVTGVRTDGYHELSSLFVRLSLGDDLSVVVDRPGEPDSLVIEGDGAVPVEGNLVLRAAAYVRAWHPAGAALPGLRFRLRKRIPMGGGLGGGSADAAAALDLAPATWGIAMPEADWMQLAARLGADVPFCALGVPAAHVTGIGERIAPLPALATPAVFRAHDAGAPAGPAAAIVVDELAREWASLDGPSLAARATALRDANDLWPAVARLDPALARLRDDLEARLRIPLLLTGSGSTLVGLYPSPGAARDAARAIGRPDRSDHLPFRTITTADARPGATQEDLE